MRLELQPGAFRPAFNREFSEENEQEERGRVRPGSQDGAKRAKELRA